MSNIMSKAKRRAPEPEREQASQTCMAAGCPLPWTCTDSLKCETGRSTGLCRYHYGKPSQRWNQITRYIDENMSLYRAAANLTNALDFHSSPKRFEFAGYPHGDDDMYTYKRRLMGEFRQKVDF